MKALWTALLTAALLPLLHAQPEPIKPGAMMPILIRVAADGTCSGEQFEPLPTPVEIATYLDLKKQVIEGQGRKPQLEIRGNREALGIHSQVIIHCAIQANLHRDIISSVWPTLEKPNPQTKKPRSVIAVTANGRVAMDGKPMDEGPDDRQLKRMADELAMAAVLDAKGPGNLKIEVRADTPPTHPRVGDVLDVLAGVGIKRIVFDGPDAKE